MGSWERHYSNIKNNTWQTHTDYDEQLNLDDDEIYLRDERYNKFVNDGLCLCPKCEILFEVTRDEMSCPECEWSLEEELK